MKAQVLFLLTLTLLIRCSGQTAEQKEIYSKEFNWSIKIPDNFDNVSGEEWEKMQNKGLSAIEKTYGQDVENKSKIIFVFKSGQLNYFESNYQPFDEDVDGDYGESFEAVNQILYETFISQMPGIEIDTARTTEVIDNLDFHVYKMKITYPNDMVLNFMMYSRLFDKREFTVNIIYVDGAKGEQMKQAWVASKFKK
jgi:hypothetical protein